MTASDLLRRVDVTLLHSLFLERLRSLLADCLAVGHAYWAVSGFRSYEEQRALYEQGRSAPGLVVTSAKPGQSAHNFGIAVDVCRDGDMAREGLQPDYDAAGYEPLRELAPRHGLAWGGTWRFVDKPHLQLPNFETAQQLAPLRLAYTTGGLLSAWRKLEELS